MGSVDRRLEDLEAHFQRSSPGEAGEHNPERERIIEKLKANWPAFEEKMAAEEAKGDFTRRRALDELRERVERRRRGE